MFVCGLPGLPLDPTLQNNEHIRGALLVGILRVAKVGWLCGVNNLSVSHIYSSSIPPYKLSPTGIPLGRNKEIFYGLHVYRGGNTEVV